MKPLVTLLGFLFFILSSCKKEKTKVAEEILLSKITLVSKTMLFLPDTYQSDTSIYTFRYNRGKLGGIDNIWSSSNGEYIRRSFNVLKDPSGKVQKLTMDVLSAGGRVTESIDGTVIWNGENISEFYYRTSSAEIKYSATYSNRRFKTISRTIDKNLWLKDSIEYNSAGNIEFVHKKAHPPYGKSTYLYDDKKSVISSLPDAALICMANGLIGYKILPFLFPTTNNILKYTVSTNNATQVELVYKYNSDNLPSEIYIPYSNGNYDRYILEYTKGQSLEPVVLANKSKND